MIPRSHTRLLVVVADGVRPDVLASELDGGRLPAMAALREAGGLYAVSSSFPSVTGPRRQVLGGLAIEMACEHRGAVAAVADRVPIRGASVRGPVVTIVRGDIVLVEGVHGSRCSCRRAITLRRASSTCMRAATAVQASTAPIAS